MSDRDLLFARVIEEIAELQTRLAELEAITRKDDDGHEQRIERSRQMIRESRELLRRLGADGR